MKLAVTYLSRWIKHNEKKFLERNMKRLISTIPKWKEKEKNSFLFLNNKRTYFIGLNYNNVNKKKVLSEIQELYDNILTSNWNDYFSLVLNIPIWEGITTSIEESVKALEIDDEIKKAKTELDSLLDILFILEDLRDHINELLEQTSRSTGLAGTGILSSFQISNINEHIDFLKKKYEELLKTYPVFKYQINLVLGKGLALLRQKYDFEWKYMHEFFF